MPRLDAEIPRDPPGFVVDGSIVTGRILSR